MFNTFNNVRDKRLFLGNPLPYACYQCDKWFRRPAEVQKHRISVHGAGESNSSSNEANEDPVHIKVDLANSWNKNEDSVIVTRNDEALADNSSINCIYCSKEFPSSWDKDDHVLLLHMSKLHSPFI